MTVHETKFTGVWLVLPQFYSAICAFPKSSDSGDDKSGGLAIPFQELQVFHLLFWPSQHSSASNGFISELLPPLDSVSRALLAGCAVAVLVWHFPFRRQRYWARPDSSFSGTAAGLYPGIYVVFTHARVAYSNGHTTLKCHLSRPSQILMLCCPGWLPVVGGDGKFFIARLFRRLMYTLRYAYPWVNRNSHWPRMHYNVKLGQGQSERVKFCPPKL